MKAKNRQFRVTVLEQFCIDFAGELDIMQSETAFPDWVYCRRDEVLSKLTPETRKIARRLREMGLRFKMKWPIEVDGKWKYADFYFPRQRTVIIVTSMALNFRPMGFSSERAEFFKDRFRVIEIENLADLERKMERKLAMA